MEALATVCPSAPAGSSGLSSQPYSLGGHLGTEDFKQWVRECPSVLRGQEAAGSPGLGALLLEKAGASLQALNYGRR